MDTTGTNINYNANYCGNRLPCGYCTLLSRPCPMFPATVTPTWKITCEAIEDAPTIIPAEEGET